MISGIKGHFFKRFLDKTTRNDAQYTYLDAAAARKFVKDDYAPFIRLGKNIMTIHRKHKSLLLFLIR